MRPSGMIRNSHFGSFGSPVTSPKTEEEVDSHGGLSMLQRQAAIPKPWESNVYIIGNYHKSGVHMTGGLFFSDTAYIFFFCDRICLFCAFLL